jgi:hypothetical protein
MKTLLQELWAELKEVYISDDLYVPSFMEDIEKNQKNYTLFEKYSKSTGTIIKTIEPSIVVKYFNDGYIFCLDYNIKRITFYLNIEFDTIKPEFYDTTHHRTLLPIKYVKINGLYRDKNKPYLNGIAEYVYFNFLVKKFKTVSSDHTQSNYGKNFWKKLANIAFSKNCMFYVFHSGELYNIESDDKDETPYEKADIIQFDNAQEFSAFVKHNEEYLWSNKSPDYHNFRLYISSVGLYK